MSQDKSSVHLVTVETTAERVHALIANYLSVTVKKKICDNDIFILTGNATFSHLCLLKNYSLSNPMRQEIN
jgi:peptidase E